MSEPFLAEVRIFGFNFAPPSWAQCDGQILPINQNQSLYSLLGTTYGGDGETSFALPDLRGRVPIHLGTNPLGGANHKQGQRSGEERVTLSEQTMPSHSHGFQALGDNADTEEPQDAWLARAATNTYVQPGPNPTVVALRAGSITSNAGSQSHENMQPSTVLNFCIALQGLFPSPN